MDADRSHSRDITSTTLQVIFIVLMITAGFWTIHPFLTPLIWATIIVVATWPVMLRVQAFLRGRRYLAVAVMATGLLMLLVVPLSLAITTIANKSAEILGWTKYLAAMSPPQPPRWLSTIPALGPKLTETWSSVTMVHSPELAARLVPYSRVILTWFVNQAGNLGVMVLDFFLTVIIAALLYAKGETASGGATRLAFRLAGPRGENTLVLAAKAVRGVALGVVLTALLQTVIGGIGLAVAGVPAFVLLTGIMFLFCIAQLGPVLVLAPCIIWLYWSGQTLTGTVLLAITIAACTIDSFVRPYLIRKGVQLPLTLIFAGVIGGLIAFGIIGLFIGPVVLAVIYTLLRAWVSENGPDPMETPSVIPE